MQEESLFLLCWAHLKENFKESLRKRELVSNSVEEGERSHGKGL